MRTSETFFLLVLVVILSKCESEIQTENQSESKPKTESESSTGNVDKHEDNTPQTPLYKYKYLFTQHRNTQLEAVKRIVTLDDNTRRFELVNMMLKQIFKVTEEAKSNVTAWGYLPGDPFPENITVLESVTKIFENTALFGDMVLRLPDPVHNMYDHKKEWQLLMAWAYGFCLQSEVFEGPNLQLLSLMAQEVNLIPQDPKYFNPFKAANKEKVEKLKNEDQEKVKKKKQKKKVPRGPRMSHTEL